MARLCRLCPTPHSFPTARGFYQHRRLVHKNPKPPPPVSTFRHHPHLNGLCCDSDGEFIAENQPPPPLPDDIDWTPFPDRPSFEYAELVFEQAHLSKGVIDQLLQITAAKHVVDGLPDYRPIYGSHSEVEDIIDSIEYGESTWRTFAVRYSGPICANSPSWKREVYYVHARDTLRVAELLAASPDFRNKFDIAPYEEFTGADCRRVSDLMSGQWAYRKANEISEDAGMHGSMLVPIVLGADKTTVSVATGNQEYHPLYMSLGNVHNDMRRAHRDSVVPIAFLAIPKTAREWENDNEFRIFKKQLYHGSIAKVLEPLRPGMTQPHVMRCPDGHYRRAVFQLGPFIADYPEQVYLSGVVYGWCPRCLALPVGGFLEDAPRFREHTDGLRQAYDPETLWDVFGVNTEVEPFMSQFPRADIHELLSPDLLHQLIKGTFKDHLVQWVLEYIKATAESERKANQIIDDIDRRLAAVPAFPGLRRFPQGRNFKQWTGDDSKALMKIFVPAIVGYVPTRMIQCITALLDFTYLARRSAHDSFSLLAMEQNLARFHQLRDVFEVAGIRPDGFVLPCQHALVHYVRSIQLFGSPNGLCSSITESRHITAVKKPWRSSSRHNSLGQIIRKNTRLSKLAAARVEFGRRNMLYSDVLTHAFLTTGADPPNDVEAAQDMRYRELADAIASDDSPAEAQVSLSSRPAYVTKIRDLGEILGRPQLLQHIRRFLHRELNPDEDVDDLLQIDLPYVWHGARVSVYYSGASTFYAPSEHAGPHGMHREMIRCTPSWYGAYSRYDTVLVTTDQDAIGMDGMTVARVLSFFAFTDSDDSVLHQCALVEWFVLDDEVPDEATGMWVVKPELSGDGERVTDVISIKSIVRACHLIGVYGTTRLPADFAFHDSLDAFNRYYINWYADYHAHELIL
ncbi:hypothetical protein C2E23DRAFT_872599 [Lenzites betulinus]|nr:hypothetical protein C2E23DRAFT_872599 [Lenzites betulinus]